MRQSGLTLLPPPLTLVGASQRLKIAMQHSFSHGRMVQGQIDVRDVARALLDLSCNRYNLRKVSHTATTILLQKTDFVLPRQTFS